jgi:hypothetical protein
MKYTSEIEISEPVDRIVELFDNSDILFKWMKGLQSFEHISGTAGQPGTKSGLKFKMDKHDIEMTETILVTNLPAEFTGTYEVKGVYNIVKNRFQKIDEHKTRYITEQEFQFKGFMKCIAFLMPGAFKKESMKHLVNFKKFAGSA